MSPWEKRVFFDPRTSAVYGYLWLAVEDRLEGKAIRASSITWKGSAKDACPGRWSWEKLAKKAKHSDAVMTGILVTKFKKVLIVASISDGSAGEYQQF